MRLHACSTLLFCLLLAACSGAPPREAADNYQATNFTAPAANSLIVLLPKPKTSSLEEDAGHDFALQQMYKQLTAVGYRVTLLNAESYAALRAQEIAAVGGLYDPNNGALRKDASARVESALAQKICAQTGCSHVIGHRLVTRKAVIGSLTAEWDGQSRPIEKTNTGGNLSYFKGTTTGMSLEVTVLSVQGTLALHRFGGVSLPHEMDMAQSKGYVRKDLFKNDQEVADGVRIALRPLLNQKLAAQ